MLLPPSYFRNSHNKSGDGSDEDEEKGVNGSITFVEDLASSNILRQRVICQTKFKSKAIITMVIFFFLITPIGIGIGIGISNVYDENSPLFKGSSTSFIFSISPVKKRLPGHGVAFIFVPFTGINGSFSVQHLGLFNFTNDGKSDNHVFAVEFDVFKNQDFNDTNDNHVGINVNSLASVASQVVGYWYGNNDENFKELKLNNGVNYQVLIDYLDSMVNVTMAEAGTTRPNRPLISASLNLSRVLLDKMYVGFTGATGQLVESHWILSWGFGPWNSSIGDGLATRDFPSFVVSNGSVFRSKGFIIGVSVCSFVFVLGCAAVVFVILHCRKKEDTKDWELEYWPHWFGYQEIEAATKGFSEKNVIGFGGSIKGVLVGGLEVAVKRISHESGRGMREFLAEVSSLDRLKHRNLVGLRGWCKREKGSLILVYDYMVNGSLNKRIFIARRV